MFCVWDAWDWPGRLGPTSLCTCRRTGGRSGWRGRRPCLCWRSTWRAGLGRVTTGRLVIRVDKWLYCTNTEKFLYCQTSCSSCSGPSCESHLALGLKGEICAKLPPCPRVLTLEMLKSSLTLRGAVVQIVDVTELQQAVVPFAVHSLHQLLPG